MHMRYALIMILPALVFFLNCGSGTSVKKGDRFETLVELQEAADIQGDMEYSDGFTCTIPKGTVLEALFPVSSSGFFECKPVVVDGKIEVGKRMKMTLSCDHRAVDGAMAAAFLTDLKTLIENPRELK